MCKRSVPVSCGTCGADQDALPEQDTQIQQAVKVQRNGVP